METPAETVEASFDVIDSIKKHIEQLNPLITERGLVCIGEYPAKILLGGFVEKTSAGLPVFIQKSSEEVFKKTHPFVNPKDLVNVDAEVDTHFWFNVNSYLAKNEEWRARLKALADRFHEAILFVSLWEGLGSGLLPMLISQFKASNVNSIALAMFPSRAQPSDAHFNALASVGMCASKEAAAVVLLGRDFVEDYVGVDRDGSRMRGNRIVNYLLEMMLANEALVQELSELSRSFNVKLYTALTVTGASFKVYGSFENMLAAALRSQFLPFDLSSSSVFYVLVRMPSHLKDRLPRGKIEMATADWSRRMTSVKSIYVSEPVYVDDSSDRVDAVVLAGGFDLTELNDFLQKKAGKIKSESVKKGQLKEKEWEAVVKSLSASQ